MNELIPSFPRQVAIPYRIICKNKNEFYDLINRYNGIKSKIYFSIYQCDNEKTFNTTLIDKIAFDLDNQNCIQSAKKLSDWAKSKNYRHCIIFSTGGCWVYIRTKNHSNIKNHKDCLRNAQHYIAKQCSLTIGKNPKTDDIDYHIIGDISRVARMPGTRDLKREIYAQSVRRINLTTLDNLREMAKKQSSKVYWYGSDAIDIKPFDYPLYKSNCEIPIYNINYEITEKWMKMLPPCIQAGLITPELAHWKFRWLFTLYLKEIGFTKQVTNTLAKKYFSKHPRNDGLINNYSHYCKVQVLDLVYSQNAFFPNCENLYTDGICPGKCIFYNSLYK